MVETIRLRGHHLAVFANYLFRNKKEVDTNPNYQNSLIGLPPKRNFKKEGILSRDELFSSQLLDIITTQYSPKMKEKIDRTWETLDMFHEMQVEIVGGTDSICQGGPRYRSECDRSSENEDSITLQEYGLKVGQSITSQDLKQKLKHFYSKTGFHSPRNRMAASWRFENPDMFI